MEVLKLKKPVMIDGESKTEIAYDLDGLTGADIELASNQLKKKGVTVVSMEIDINYHMAIFAQAAGIDYEDVKRMSAKDCQNAVAAVRVFFMSDLEESSDETSSEVPEQE